MKYRALPLLYYSLLGLLLFLGYAPDLIAVDRNISTRENWNQELTAAEKHEIKYARYMNARFAFGVSYPEGILIPQGEADNGDGQKFISKDGKAIMLAYGYNNTEEFTLKTVFRGAIKNNSGLAGKVIYKKLKDNWFVVSGIKGDTVFYTKVIYKSKDDQFIKFVMSYPESQRSLYDPIVAEVSKSLKVLEKLPTKTNRE